MEGLIIKAISGFYYVETADKAVIECKARGKFKNYNQSLLVGDRVEITLDGEKGVVDAVLPRRNILNRPPVANIDKLFIKLHNNSRTALFALLSRGGRRRSPLQKKERYHPEAASADALAAEGSRDAQIVLCASRCWRSGLRCIKKTKYI